MMRANGLIPLVWSFSKLALSPDRRVISPWTPRIASMAMNSEKNAILKTRSVFTKIPHE
jgi:hypothetical protein